MIRYAAFLRGMNLGGRRITNAELVERFAALGFADVRTFRASGNVVFSSERPEPAAHVEVGLREALGYEVPTYLRTRDEMAEIAAASPFPAEAVAASSGKLQVTMLREAPDAQARARVLVLGDDEDRLAFGERELYWLPRGRTTDSLLDLKQIAALLEPGTMRTKSTVEQLWERCMAP